MDSISVIDVKLSEIANKKSVILLQNAFQLNTLYGLIIL